MYSVLTTIIPKVCHIYTVFGRYSELAIVSLYKDLKETRL